MRQALRCTRMLTFSPLFIGEVSSTRLQVAASADARTLSVPSSSGKSLQRVQRPGGDRIGSSFSPLFIGEVSSTSNRESEVRPIFLSVPSSSGKCLFNAARSRAHSPRAIVLSVPSSSGRSLQRMHRSLPPAASAHTFQSPLHRGCLFDSTAPSASVPAAWHFQSPLHRGVSLQPFR